MSTGTVLTANPRFKCTPFFASGRQDMTRKSDREKSKMKINHGVFEKALGEEGVLGTVLQSGLCDKGVDKVHAPGYSMDDNEGQSERRRLPIWI